jgi:hypothetical protein
VDPSLAALFMPEATEIVESRAFLPLLISRYPFP